MRVAQAMGNPSCGAQKKKEKQQTPFPDPTSHYIGHGHHRSRRCRITFRPVSHIVTVIRVQRKEKEKRCGKLQTTVIIMTESHPTIVSYYARTAPWGCCGWFPNSIICFIKKPFSSMNCSSSNPMNKDIRLGFGHKICEIWLTPAIIMKFG